MRLATKHFGSIEVDEKGIIRFEDGLPGFEEVKEYIILENGGGDSPFRWLQGVDDPGLAFAVVDPFMILKDYDITISDEAVERLEIESAEDLLIFSIVVVPEELSKMSMNLKAPVVINIKKHTGIQVVLDTDRYGVRHYILEELRRQEVAGDACAHKEEGPVHCNR